MSWFPIDVILLRQFVALLVFRRKLINWIAQIRFGVILGLMTVLLDYGSRIVRPHRQVLPDNLVIVRNIALSHLIMQQLLSKDFRVFLVLPMSCKAIPLVKSIAFV